ncbi:MAG: trypsin-like peptidase domain-containing protein [Calditrichia bacterium]
MYKIGKIQIFILAVFAAALLLAGCGSDKSARAEGEDSLFLSSAYAQTDSAKLNQANRNVMDSRQTAITRAVAKAEPAVVGINVMAVKRYVKKSPFYSQDPLWKAIFPELFRDQVYEQKLQSLGSGFIISPDGYIITNQHVVEDAQEIIATLPGGERHNAELIGTDKVSDIALLKIDARNLPYLELGNSDDLIVGEWVIALGNPFGLFQLNDQPTVTVGVISAINRDWGRTETGSLYMDMIQTDASINHGNSGGPLVNALGQVIGMNTFIFTGSRYEEGSVGIGFAIPINRIREVSDEIRKNGGIDRNYSIGFKVQDLNAAMVRALNLDVKEGVIISQVERGSSADKAGLLSEDILLEVNGKNIKNTNSLLNILGNTDLRVGDELDLLILRNKQRRKIQMKLIENAS